MLCYYSWILIAFNNHFSFHGSYFGMNYSNITGFILLVSLIIQFFSGLLSSSYYEDYVVPRPDPAVYTMSDVNNGWTIRFLHVLGATLFMLFVYFHLMRGSRLMFKLFDDYINLIWLPGRVIYVPAPIEGS